MICLRPFQPISCRYNTSKWSLRGSLLIETKCYGIDLFRESCSPYIKAIRACLLNTSEICSTGWSPPVWYKFTADLSTAAVMLLFHLKDSFFWPHTHPQHIPDTGQFACKQNLPTDPGLQLVQKYCFSICAISTHIYTHKYMLMSSHIVTKLSNPFFCGTMKIRCNINLKRERYKTCVPSTSVSKYDEGFVHCIIQWQNYISQVVCMPVALNPNHIKPMSCTQLLKTVAYSKLLQHNTFPLSHNQDVFHFDWQELLLGIKDCYYLSCLCQIGIDWCHLLSGTAQSEYTLPCELWACCWRWLLSVYRGSVSRFMSVIDFHVPIKACNQQNTVLFPCRCVHAHI